MPDPKESWFNGYSDQEADAGSFRDSTERKLAEKALRKSEETFRKVAENALIGIVVVQGGTYEYVNPAFAEITGRTPEELEGRSPKKIVHPEDWPKVQKKMEKRQGGNQDATRYQARLLSEAVGDRPAETRYVNVQGSRINYRGTPALIATVQDVTERRRLRREVLQVQEEERRRIGQELHDRVASQLTSARFMLSSLSGRVEEEREERIQRIQESIEESAEVVRRLTRGLSPEGLADGDLPAALDGLAQSVDQACFESLLGEDRSQNGPQGTERRIVSALEAETATHLYRIVQEAVSNARFHGHARGILVRLQVGEGALILEVKDDGTGFDSSAIEEKARLGLRSMQYRAELIGADLSVESNRGDGTYVRVRLPL